MTAFFLEDNQLWRCHLLTLLAQASGADYAIYRYTWVWPSRGRGRGLSKEATMILSICSDTPTILKKGMTLKSKAKMDREELILLDFSLHVPFRNGAFSNVNR